MKKPHICVVGLGYVGLPLAVEMARKFPVTGFDINARRVKTLQGGSDPNGEVSDAELKQARLRVTDDPAAIADADFIIIAVPTPIDKHKNPDLGPVLKASETVGKRMKRGAIVAYESTVYPGATEEECVPVLERESGMRWKSDFFVGYSPERINPGDKVHTFSSIVKVVSGDTPDTLDRVTKVYGAVVKAGVYQAASIQVAEAAKVIENTQRDINIALMNELQIIFDKMGISTKEVLEAARTKWNFLPFEPGLVGGHCIGVDPYYLAFKAEEIGHHPQIIMAGRRINDAMGRYYARELIKRLIHRGRAVRDARVLMCGITFKENVPDIRNSKVISIIEELRDFGLSIEVWDPLAYPGDVRDEYGISLVKSPAKKSYDAVVLAVKHAQFLARGERGLRKLMRKDGILYDIKEVL
ncbi:MAG: nucleotide sugar dehydrogenase [Chitinivibrionales bacterium]|nr:nucleotide sugar dehydrogenase [Chitinivibrionales bacterium]MBD3394280.1 nucleotide sugar dehydrogenase [Chitinivibrionales bacterium]